MISKNLKAALGDGLRIANPPDGVDLGDGNIKTSRGTIRVPKSEARKNRPAVAEQPQVLDAVKAVPPPPVYNIMVYTEIGGLPVRCREITRTDNFLIIGLADNTFSPKSFNEDPNLRLDIEADGVRDKYVYIGCKWLAKNGITYVVLMKGPEDAEESIQ